MSSVLTEIAAWMLDAKLEDNRRYFYNTGEVALLSNGAKSFILGRKGSGKTAIREHLVQIADPTCFAETLTFKSFPFSELYKCANNQYTHPNQYITLWKWVIYCHIATMMLRNEAIRASVRLALSKAFPPETMKGLARYIARVTSPEFRLSFMGLEIFASAKRATEENTIPWIDRCDFLEEFIAQHLDDSRYTIAFDELDDDYVDVGRRERRQDYIALLTSLFKAVQDIRSVFPRPRYRVCPVVFLRDDIFHVMRDPDRTKWSDNTLELSWTGEELVKLLCFRLARASEPEAVDFSPRHAFSPVFGSGEQGEREGVSTTTLMISQSLQRPRDLISFCKLAAAIATAGGGRYIDGQIIRMAQERYSAYLRSEIEDEIGGLVPDISAVIDLLASIRRPTFGAAEFVGAYEGAARAGKVESRDAKGVLEILFHFSVVGNAVAGRASIFRFRNRGARLNVREQVTILPGLRATLNIADDQLDGRDRREDADIGWADDRDLAEDIDETLRQAQENIAAAKLKKGAVARRKPIKRD